MGKIIMSLLFTIVCNSQINYKNIVDKNTVDTRIGKGVYNYYNLEDGSRISTFKKPKGGEIEEIIVLPTTTKTYKTIIKTYYKNGDIKSKRHYISGILIDTTYLYSKKGKLIKTINENKKFRYSYNVILKFLETIEYLNSTKEQKIFYLNYKKNKWFLDYLVNDTNEWIEYIIDAKTGKVISKTVEDAGRED